MDERDPARVFEALRRHHIGFVLMKRASRANAFDGANYPASFLVTTQALVGRGELAVVWASNTLVLLEVKGRAAVQPTLPRETPIPRRMLPGP